MEVRTPFGITLMQRYKEVMSTKSTLAVTDYPYLVGVNSRSGVQLCWIQGCKDHDEALDRGQRKLVVDDSEPVEYGVVGPCAMHCACGRLRCRTYFVV